MLLIESCLTVLALLAAFTVPTAGSRWFGACERVFSKLAQRRQLAVLVVGLAALAARAALLPILPIPQPAVQDEFGYLLLADTFAHGRLTNPTHPMWIHFETLHVIWHPTYAAKFWPAQGLIMALGQVVLGHPFWGVWLSVGLMCAAICWMLQAWVPPGWALLGGFLAVIRLGTFSYWANGYFGGAVAATGGALVLGALPRIKSSLKVGDALLMGLGLAILANSRPYEGLFFGLPIAGALALWILRKDRPPLGLAARRVVAPLLVVLVLTGCAMAYYNWRTTGSPWDPPYLVYNRLYGTPFLPWQSLGKLPVFHHAVMRDFCLGYELGQFKESRTMLGVVNRVFALVLSGGFYLWPALTLPLAVAFVTLPRGFSWKQLSSNTRFLLLVCATVIAGSMLPFTLQPHYLAPLTGAILALVLIAMRRLRVQSWRRKETGLFLTRAVPAICVLMLVLRAGAKPLHLPLPDPWPGGLAASWCSPAPGNVARARMLSELSRLPGRQLVIVRYGPRHDLWYHEWVFNEADLETAKVLWARDMGPAQNEELVDYFHDRHVWLLEADDTFPRVVPYGLNQNEK
jgi:hypothetical protein